MCVRTLVPAYVCICVPIGMYDVPIKGVCVCVCVCVW